MIEAGLQTGNIIDPEKMGAKESKDVSRARAGSKAVV